MPATILPCPVCQSPHTVVHDASHSAKTIARVLCARCLAKRRPSQKLARYYHRVTGRKRQLVEMMAPVVHESASVAVCEVGYDVMKPESGE